MARVSEFNKFRFQGFEYKVCTIKYMTMNRVSADQEKIVVRVDPRMLFKTQYGYGMHLNENHVLYLKDWQVDMNPEGCEILLNHEYFKPKEFGFSKAYAGYDHLLNWQTWVKIALKQDSSIDESGNKATEVRWMLRGNKIC